MKSVFPKFTYTTRADIFTLWYLTDWHVGAKAFDEKLFRRHVDEIEADDHAFWIGGGDYVDAVAHVNDKRYKPETIAPWALGKTDLMGTQVRYAANLVKPIAKKCLALLEGNHEWVGRKYYARDIYAEFVQAVADKADKQAGELALGAGGFINLNFRRITPNSSGGGWNFTIFAHHGHGGGRLHGGHALTLGRTLSDFEADLVLMGHRHVLNIIARSVAVPHRSGARLQTRYGIFMPSYLGSYIPTKVDESPINTYPEELALPATPVGSFPIDIHPDTKSVVLRVGFGTG